MKDLKTETKEAIKEGIREKLEYIPIIVIQEAIAEGVKRYLQDNLYTREIQDAIAAGTKDSIDGY